MADGSGTGFPRNPEAFEKGALGATLTQLLDCALADTQARIDWYSAKAGTMAFWARMVRRMALFLFIAATTMPLFALLLRPAANDTGFRFTEAGYLLLALAAGLVLFDQFFGLSRSWMRFRQSEAKLGAMATQLRYAWAATLAEAGGDAARPRVARRLTAMLTAHATAVEALLEAETKEWADDFRAQIEGFDRKVQAAQADAMNRAQVAADAALSAAAARADAQTDEDDEPEPERPRSPEAPQFQPHRWTTGEPEEGVL